MKLKTLFFLLTLLLLGAWSILFFFVLREEGTLVYVSEAVVTLSLIVLVYFYQKVVQPLNSIANGMDLLREQDFSSRLAPVRQAEADRIVDMFNRMMDQLTVEASGTEPFPRLAYQRFSHGGGHPGFRRKDFDAEHGGHAFSGLYGGR